MTQNNNNNDDNVNISVVRPFRHARSSSPLISFTIIGVAALFTLILCSLLTGNFGFVISFASAQEQDDNNNSSSGEIIVVVVPVRHGDQSFDVRASITNGITIKEIIVDQDFASLIISLENNSNDTAATGILMISLPRSLIDAKAAAGSNSEAAADDVFVVVAGQQELDYHEVRTTDTERELRISIPPNSSEIEIVGTQVMPEFPFPLLAFAVIVAVVTVISKQRREGLRISKSQGVSFRL